MSLGRTLARCLSISLLLMAPTVDASAGASTEREQAARGRLLVTVIDQTRAVLPGATVTATPADDGGRHEPNAAAVHDALTSSVGVASIDGLPPGRYTVRVQFPGFQPATVTDVRVRNGDNKCTVTLQLEKVNQELTVERDKQAAALDPQGAAFSTVLTREQIAALPDDPDEMEAALKAMAPPGATIRVDGFTGGKLPPKAQIRSIRLPRMDMLAAQNHGGLGGHMFIDIMTQPGVGPLRGSVDVTFRDAAMNARNPFAVAKGDERLQRYGFSMSGTVRPNRSSFSVNVQRGSQFDTGNLLAALPGTRRAEPVRQPADNTNISARFDQAIGKDHTMRMAYQRNGVNRRNLGIGGYDLPERAYETESSDNLLRWSETGPRGRRFFSESRVQLRWMDSASRSALEAPAVRVLDAFTSGGAQQAGGSRAIEFEAATDLDYVRGRHSMRTGVLVEGGRYRSDETSNYLGTFTFSSLADYQAGRPAGYTRRIGDPLVRYSNLQAGAYVQDDFRLWKTTLLSYGVRYEAQSLIADQNNVSPRVSLTWSPFKSGKTSFRAGVGLFSDWLGNAVYRQSLQLDGARQRELNVLEPAYPDPGLDGSIPPANRYLLGPGLVLPESASANAGVDQQVIGNLRMNLTYTYRRGSKLLRGRNINALVNGARPDPLFVNVVEAVSDAGSRSHSVNVGANLMAINWHRTFFAANYSFTTSETNTSGPFAMPASADAVALEWGNSAVRHRGSVMFNTMPVRDFTVNLTFRAQSGMPYNITTGLDDNRDGVFNDRPAGMRRNAALTPGQWDLGARLSYAIGFGTRPQSAGPGGTQVVVMIGGPGGGMPAGGFGGGAENKRYRVEFYASAQNLTNRGNLVGFSGVMTSPFFAQPTTVLNPRKVELGIRFGF